MKNDLSLQSDCFGRTEVYKGSLMFRPISKVSKEHDSEASDAERMEEVSFTWARGWLGKAA